MWENDNRTFVFIGFKLYNYGIKYNEGGEHHDEANSCSNGTEFIGIAVYRM